jgi:hypothetical protein
MTDEMMSLRTLPEKSADANLLCKFQRKAAYRSDLMAATLPI